ncbi:MAG: class I SAM-dependent methyltransferase [Bacteroidales bacterium]|nr:class I SAM-dependent methyltransferase [Bacteroidales bacterium]
MNINESTWQYIAAHSDDDVTHLALHPSKDPQVDMAMALQQIAGRQKAKEKLPEWYATEGVLYPKKVSMEQCSSSQTAEYKASLVEGESFADFSGGFGVDTIALARKFDKGWYVEPQEELCELFQHNCKVLDINNVNIIHGTMEEHLAAIGPVNTIYIDPSRRDTHGRRVVSLADCTPNLLKWKSALLERCNTLMVKLSPMIDIFQTLRDLPETYAVHVIAVEGECKEVVFLLSRDNFPVNDIHRRDAIYRVRNSNPETDIIADGTDLLNETTDAINRVPTIVAVDICKNATSSVESTLETERTTPPRIATELGAYLYEPNAAVMKAGIFNALSQQFQIAKLAKNTNLFTADELHEDFPGRVFRIEAVHEFHPRKTAKELSHLASASIAVRNFPLSAEELRKTLKIKNGNAGYLFGCTLWDGKKIILLTQKKQGE